MSILAWIVLGLIAGVIANYVDPRPAKGGLLAAAVLGILGGLVGGFISSVFTGVGVTGLDLTSLAIAVLGSLSLLYIGRTFNRG